MLNPKDLKIETFRATGNGGQNINKVESAVRITHLPTGLSATSQDERSQGQNKKKALETLEQRVNERTAQLHKAKLDMFRSTMYAGRVRTYNFTDDTVTDYRTKKRVKGVKKILDGDLDLIR